MFSAYVNCFKIPELKKRLLFTLGLIALVELAKTIPCPGIDPGRLKELFADLNNNADNGGIMGMLNLFSGGAMEQFAIGALGIMPYISASIVLQLMTPVIPALNKMVREGESGMQQYNFIMRVLTVIISVVQGVMFSLAMMRGIGQSGSVVVHPGMGFIVQTVIILTGGAMFVTWLGEQITERGVGNGASLIITINIVARLPQALTNLYQLVFTGSSTGESQLNILHLLILVVLFVAVTVGAIMLTEGMRKIPIHYVQQRSFGGRSMGSAVSYLPLRVNYANVMPIIFAGAILSFVSMGLRYLAGHTGSKVVYWLNSLFDFGSLSYIIIYAVLLLLFSFFWVANQFNPIQIADDLQKNNGYIPGITPGKATSDFLDHAMTRITLGGAFGLMILAIIPMLLATSLNIPHTISQFFGGTSLLIIVGVMLDTLRQIQTYLISRNYDGFLSKGILRNHTRV